MRTAFLFIASCGNIRVNYLAKMHARMQANIFTGQREREREKCQKKSGNGYS